MSASTTAASSASSLSSTFVEVCAQIAPVSSVFLNLAPLPTIQSIRRHKSVGTLPLLPYTCMACNCVLWGVYGVLKHEPAMWAPNVVGVALCLYYITSFVQYAPRHKSSTLPGTVTQHVATVASVALVTVVSAAQSWVPTNAIGQAAVVLCIAMFASPLVSIKTVLAEKSARSIPLPFTIASITNTFTWLVAGYYKWKDKNIVVPNVLGLMFGFLQILLKLIYGNSTGPARVAP